MRFSRPFALALVTLLCSEPAGAACFVCDDVVELDAPLAACFVALYPGLVEQAEADPRGRAEVDFTECTGVAAEDLRGLESFPAFPEPDEPDPAPQRARHLRQSYVFDIPGLECLGRVIRGLEMADGEIHSISISRDCTE